MTVASKLSFVGGPASLDVSVGEACRKAGQSVVGRVWRRMSWVVPDGTATEATINRYVGPLMRRFLKFQRRDSVEKKGLAFPGLNE